MRRLPAILLVLAPLVALWPGLAGLALGPFDAIRAMMPGGPPASASAQPWDVLMADSVLQSHVWRTLVLDAWGKGQLPLWNPYEFAGTPLLADSQSGGFYPPHILLGILHVPSGSAGFLLAWFHLALAGLGTSVLVRRMGGSSAGGLTAGLAFALSPFLLGWAPLSSVPATVAWIPLALACVVAGDRRSLAALAACVGMMLLGGHLQFAAYGLMALVLFAAFRLPLSSLRRKPSARQNVAPADASGLGGAQANLWKHALAPFLALALGAALAAPQIMPVLAYSKESHRRNIPTEEGYQAYVGSALRPFELATLAYPMALGSPREGVDIGGRTVAAYWPAFAKPGGNFAESAVGVGAVVLALLFAVPWRRRETWPLAALALLALGLALGTPLDRLLYFGVPGWSSTGSPARVESLFVLAACALAGLAVDRLAERKSQILAAVGGFLGLVLALVLPGLASADGAVAALRGSATAGAMLPALGATVVTLLALFAGKRTLWAIPVGVVAVACLGHALVLVPFGRPLDPPKGDPNVRIAVVNDAWDLFSAAPALLPPNLAALGGLHELSGYDSLTSRDAVGMLRTVNGGIDPAPAANGNLMFVKPTLDPKALAECGVTEVWSRRELPQLGVAEQRGGYLAYRIEGPGRVTGGSVVDGYDRQIVRPRGKRGPTVVRDRLAEGWVDEAGRPLKAYDPTSVEPFARTGRWREIDSPADGAVTTYYRPPGLASGLAIGALAWITLGFLIFARRSVIGTRSV